MSVRDAPEPTVSLSPEATVVVRAVTWSEVIGEPLARAVSSEVSQVTLTVCPAGMPWETVELTDRSGAAILTDVSEQAIGGRTAGYRRDFQVRHLRLSIARLQARRDLIRTVHLETEDYDVGIGDLRRRLAGRRARGRVVRRDIGRVLDVGLEIGRDDLRVARTGNAARRAGLQREDGNERQRDRPDDDRKDQRDDEQFDQRKAILVARRERHDWTCAKGSGLVGTTLLPGFTS